MTAIVAVLVFAALFAAFGLLQPKKQSCGGNCGACLSTCELTESIHDES